MVLFIFKPRLKKIVTAWLFFLLAGVAVAQQSPAQAPAQAPDPEARIRTLEEQVRVLEERLARLEAGTAPPQAAAAASAPAPSTGVAPKVPVSPPEVPVSPVEAPAGAAARLQAIPITATSPPVKDSEESVRLPFAGYMEFHLNKPRGESGQFDFHRFVLLFGHSFSSRIKFWSELELEHSLVEGGEEKGELELEQAYLDFYLNPYFNLRGGMVLAPMGVINERHEPPAFFGVERPMVDTVIIPSTWFDLGVGAWGDLGRGFTYRFYLMSPLDATGFSADEGLRGGRQKGSRSNLRNVARTARVEYRGIPRLTLGGSVWAGRTGFDTPNLDVPVRLGSFDGRYSWRRVEFRGQYAHGQIQEAGLLNRTLQRRIGINPNIAEQIRGFYLESAVYLLPFHSSQNLAVFTRYENFDTQYRMPSGFLPLKQFDRSSWTVGASYFPHPDVVFKADYVFNRNASQVIRPRDQVNFGLGWWF